MSFVLTSAPAAFQRLIDRFRSGLQNILMLSYLDEKIVVTETFKEHLADLIQFLTVSCDLNSVQIEKSVILPELL